MSTFRNPRYEIPTPEDTQLYYFNLPIFQYFGPEQCTNIFDWDAGRDPIYAQENNFLEDTILVAKYNPKGRLDPLKCYFGSQRRGYQNDFEDATYLKYLDIDTETDPAWLEELARDGATSGMLRDTK